MPDDTHHPDDGNRPEDTGVPSEILTEAPPTEWDAGKTTRDRVYEVAIQLREPATTSDVAERADCSVDAARSHLDWLADVGVVTREEGHPTTYRRNESYFEWRRVEELRREHTPEELLARLEDLTAEERDFRERYDATHPDDVDALAAADHATVHEAWEDLTDWRTVRREIRLLERARRTSGRGYDRKARPDD